MSPATDASKKELWDETWKRVDRFLPDLRAEVAPVMEPETKTEKKADDETKPAEAATDAQETKQEETAAADETTAEAAPEEEANEKTEAEKTTDEDVD